MIFYANANTILFPEVKKNVVAHSDMNISSKESAISRSGELSFIIYSYRYILQDYALFNMADI